jgi:hypothetical protein
VKDIWSLYGDMVARYGSWEAPAELDTWRRRMERRRRRRRRRRMCTGTHAHMFAS